MERLRGWCEENNLFLNTNKAKELVVDYRRNNTDIRPLLIGGDQVEKVAAFTFLGMTIEQDLTWTHEGEMAGVLLPMLSLHQHHGPEDPGRTGQAEIILQDSSHPEHAAFGQKAQLKPEQTDSETVTALMLLKLQ